MNITYRTVGAACTTLEERKEYGRILPADKGYLTEKTEYALRFPRIRTVRKKDGTTTQALLQQLVVSAAIRADEFLADFYWHYKAEVCFDMRPRPPKPYLSSGGRGDGPDRRHTLNPFPSGNLKGALRRPDVVIVEDATVKWPGLATSDHEGNFHPDNLRRVVEMKFPGDDLPEHQRRAYLRIAGEDARRLVIVDVNDCQGDLKKIRRELQHSSTAQLPLLNDVRKRAPVRSRSPIAEPAFYEQWLSQLEDGVEQVNREAKSLIDEARRGIHDLSVETQAWLRRQAAWLFEAGKWIRDAATGSWIWINESGQAVVRWTQEILIAAWREVQRQTDLAWEQIKEIDWGQIVITLAATVAVVALAFAGAIVVVAISEALLAALLALLAIGGAGALATA